MDRLRKASLSTLLRYERSMKGRAGHELPPAIRDQVRLRISQKVTNLAVVTLVIVSIFGGVVILFHRLLS
jgi:hypothetical protein